ncbi:MAG TPA: SDR family oxidoreductase [Dehalococcoidia bacterium]|nr:SDR family oxidoreductase [Dehalococcoidia bacterium]
MSGPQLSGKRVLVLGAETDVGRAIAETLAGAGASLALVAASNDAQAAFTVQRLARRLGAAAQAIDATNEAAVRVMTRQVAKALGGLDAVVFCADRSQPVERPTALAVRFAGKELARSGGTFIAVDVEPWEQPAPEMWPGFIFISFPLQEMPQEQAVAWVLHAVAGRRGGTPA